MAQTFWSDKIIELSISNKAVNNTGISNVTVTGTNGISCSDALLSESNGTTGINSTNLGTGNQGITKVTFYLSPTSLTASSATGNVQVVIKWKGADLTENTEDDTVSDTHTINDVTVRNAIDSIITDKASYSSDWGETTLVNYTVRGEKHGSVYIPVYANKVHVEVLSQGNIVHTQDLTNQTSLQIPVGNPGDYTIRISSIQNESGYVVKTVEVPVSIIVPWLILDQKKLDYSKLK